MTQPYYLSLSGYQKEDLVIKNAMLSGGGNYDYFLTADKKYLSLGNLTTSFSLAFLDKIGKLNWQRIVNSTVANEQQVLKEAFERVFSENDLNFWSAQLRSFDIHVAPVTSEKFVA